jgi:Family of unknown function (DUF6325)
VRQISGLRTRAFLSVRPGTGRGSCRHQQLIQAQKHHNPEEAGPGREEEQQDAGRHQPADAQRIESGLIGDDDIQEAGDVLQPGSSAGILLVYENVWAGPFAAAVRRSGGQLVASGRIPVQAVLAALDAIEQDS